MHNQFEIIIIIDNQDHYIHHNHHFTTIIKALNLIHFSILSKKLFFPLIRAVYSRNSCKIDKMKTDVVQKVYSLQNIGFRHLFCWRASSSLTTKNMKTCILLSNTMIITLIWSKWSLFTNSKCNEIKCTCKLDLPSK